MEKDKKISVRTPEQVSSQQVEKSLLQGIEEMLRNQYTYYPIKTGNSLLDSIASIVNAGSFVSDLLVGGITGIQKGSIPKSPKEGALQIRQQILNRAGVQTIAPPEPLYDKLFRSMMSFFPKGVDPETGMPDVDISAVGGAARAVDKASKTRLFSHLPFYSTLVERLKSMGTDQFIQRNEIEGILKNPGKYGIKKSELSTSQLESILKLNPEKKKFHKTELIDNVKDNLPKIEVRQLEQGMYEDYVKPGKYGPYSNYRETLIRKQTPEVEFEAPHFSIPEGSPEPSTYPNENLIANLIVVDRHIVDPDSGKILKDLHIEEAQSDWRTFIEKHGKEGIDKLNAKNKRFAELTGQPFHKISYTRVPVNDEPLTKEYIDLILKVAMDEAIKGKYDSISWHVGETVAKRATAELDPTVAKIELSFSRMRPYRPVLTTKDANGNTIESFVPTTYGYMATKIGNTNTEKLLAKLENKRSALGVDSVNHKTPLPKLINDNDWVEVVKKISGDSTNLSDSSLALDRKLSMVSTDIKEVARLLELPQKQDSLYLLDYIMFVADIVTDSIVNGASLGIQKLLDPKNPKGIYDSLLRRFYQNASQQVGTDLTPIYEFHRKLYSRLPRATGTTNTSRQSNMVSPLLHIANITKGDIHKTAKVAVDTSVFESPSDIKSLFYNLHPDPTALDRYTKHYTGLDTFDDFINVYTKMNKNHQNILQYLKTNLYIDVLTKTSPEGTTIVQDMNELLESIERIKKTQSLRSLLTVSIEGDEVSRGDEGFKFIYDIDAPKSLVKAGKNYGIKPTRLNETLIVDMASKERGDEFRKSRGITYTPKPYSVKGPPMWLAKVPTEHTEVEFPLYETLLGMLGLQAVSSVNESK